MPQHPMPAPLSRADFGSTDYGPFLEKCVGRDVVEQAKALRSRPEYQAKLLRGFRESDSIADELVTKMQQNPSVRRDYEIALKQGLDAVSNPCEELKTFIRHATQPPAFLDLKMVEEGGRLLTQRLGGPSMMMYFGPISIYLQSMISGIGLGAVFANEPRGPAQALDEWALDGAMQKKQMTRFMETFEWFAKVAQAGCSQPHGESFEQNCKVRIIHAYIRKSILARREHWNFLPGTGWDLDQLGHPLNSADSAMVASTILLSLIAMRRQVKLPITDHELDAFSHWVAYLHYMQGVSEDFLWPDHRQAALQISAFLLSINTRCYNSEISALVQSVYNFHLERVLVGSKGVQVALDGLQRAAIDDLFRGDVKEIFKLKSAPFWAAGLFRIAKGILILLNLGNAILPALNRYSEKSAQKLWSETVPKAKALAGKSHGSVAL